MWGSLNRLWRYLGAALGQKVEDKADPKIQLEQAIEEAKKRHQLLSQQAATVIGQEKELDLKLSRTLEQIEELQTKAAQALKMSDAATDPAEKAKYGQAAQSFALELVTAEKQARELKGMQDQAVEASNQAKKAVEQNALSLKKQMSEKSQLLSQLENAKMQERLNAALGQMDAMAPKGDTPTLGEVREKIEQRYAKALGESELRSTTVDSTMLEVEQATLDVEAAARLDQLRHQLSMGDTQIDVGTPTPEAAPVKADEGEPAT